MKIDSILLENFGIYGGKRFRFDGQPLVLIYGANESGKTTALNGLRQALFGFPHTTPYLTGKPMSAEGIVTLSDGRSVRFTRQKKRSDAFVATVDGKIPLSESQWQELAGGLDLKTYQSLFGFSLDELRSGEKALAHAPLSEALSGSGFGGLARLQQVQGRIEGFLASTLKRTGTGGTINAKLAEIEAAEKQLEEVLTLPSDVADLRQQLSTAEESFEQLGMQLAELRAQLQRCQRQQAALPKAIEYRQVEQALQKFEIPAAIDDEFRLQWTLAQNRLAGARAELDDEQRKLTNCETALHALPVPSGTAEHAEETRRLGRDAPAIAQSRLQLAEDLREIESLERELGESLQRIGLSKHDDQWRTIQLDAAQRGQLDGASRQYATLSSQLAACRTRVEVATEQLHKHACARQANVAPENLDALEALVAEAEPVLQSCDQIQQRWTQASEDKVVADRTARFERLTQSLMPPTATVPAELDPTWSVPAAAQISQYQQHRAEAHATLERFSGELERCAQEVQRLEQNLAESQATHGLPTVDQLEALWSERDSLLAQCRDKLQGSSSGRQIDPSGLAQRLSQIADLNTRADAAVRSMLAAADRVALVISRQQQLAALAQRRTALAEQVAQARAAVGALADTWKALWAGCPIEPESPEQLGSWLDDYRQWCEQRAINDGLAEEGRRAVALRESALGKLRAQWPQDAPEVSTVAEARQQLNLWKTAVAAQAAEQRMLAELTAGHSAATRQCEELEQQLARSQSEFQQLVRSARLPEGWPIDELDSRLEAFARCQTLSGRVGKLRERLRSAETRLDEFAKGVEQHARALGVPAPTGAVEQQALAWLEQLEQSDLIEKQRTELSSAVDSHRQTVAKRQSQIVELQEKLAQLVESAGATSIEAAQSWIGSLNEVSQLRAKKAQLIAALEANAAGVSLDDFLSELATLDPRSVAVASASLMARVGSIEQERQAALERKGALLKELVT
ncbi:MAG: AAA family ATPase [Aureliella sp.]